MTPSDVVAEALLIDRFRRAGGIDQLEPAVRARYEQRRPGQLLALIPADVVAGARADALAMLAALEYPDVEPLSYVTAGPSPMCTDPACPGRTV